jgi:hypothetical protein
VTDGHGTALQWVLREFVDLIINHLTEHGVMDASRLYESPFTDITPHEQELQHHTHQRCTSDTRGGNLGSHDCAPGLRRTNLSGWTLAGWWCFALKLL